MIDHLTNLLATEPVVLIVLCAILGLVIGSFLNVVILRLPPRMERDWREQCEHFLAGHDADDAALPAFFPANLKFLAFPASTCPHCGHRIRAWENIPVLSWLLLRARCSSCAAPIAVRYPLVEALTGLLSALVAARFGFGIETALVLILTWGLIALSVIDIDTKLLPDSITLALLWLGLLANAFGLFVPPAAAIIGAAAGYLSLWLVYQLFGWVFRKEGMGYGDFKLLAVFGAWGGWQVLVPVVLLSSLAGAVLGIAMIAIGRREWSAKIPFGPYLAIAGFVAVTWREPVMQLWLRFPT